MATKIENCQNVRNNNGETIMTGLTNSENCPGNQNTMGNICV